MALYKFVREAKGDVPGTVAYLALVVDHKGRQSRYGRGTHCQHYHKTHRGAAACATRIARRLLEEMDAGHRNAQEAKPE